MLRLIKNKPNYRAALFDTELVRPVVYKIAAELLLELVQAKPHYLAR
jgi:hypothetical protein